jgi:hypothetical protein
MPVHPPEGRIKDASFRTFHLNLAAQPAFKIARIPDPRRFGAFSPDNATQRRQDKKKSKKSVHNRFVFFAAQSKSLFPNFQMLDRLKAAFQPVADTGRRRKGQGFKNAGIQEVERFNFRGTGCRDGGIFEFLICFGFSKRTYYLCEEIFKGTEINEFYD